MTSNATGPLRGIKVLEVGGIGPVPFCGMLLSDMGADVIRVTPVGGDQWPNPVTGRGKHQIELDLKSASGRSDCLQLANAADALIEGFRPGVMEKLGIGPDLVRSTNPGLIYGRMTGWGQSGPLAQAAGHDINYIALTGILAAIGSPGTVPVPPLNLVGDFGGGALYLSMAICAALVWRGHSGQGQVIDTAIVDGAASLLSTYFGFAADNRFSMSREQNVVGGAAPYYGCYLCADGRYIAVGAIEPRFFDLLLQKLEIGPASIESRDHPAAWSAIRNKFSEVFKTRSRADWCALLEGTDACFAPVLEIDEAPDHPHMQQRGVYVSKDGVRQPAPAPRFSATPLSLGNLPVQLAGIADALTAWGAHSR
jgi:alpha-methylacyl-CoA racemase